MKYNQAISKTLFELMNNHKNLILIGQGVTDFKGIWGTTIDCYNKFPSRVIETPIAEDSVAGISIGASLNGLYPINSFIRADFNLLIFNQLINLASKYRYMYGGIFCLPMIFSGCRLICHLRFSSFFTEFHHLKNNFQIFFSIKID